MELSTLEQIFARLLETDLLRRDGELTIVWHAGEPLAVPIAWYRDAFDLICGIVPRELRISHSFQSNGLLLNDRWCDFIRERSVAIGLSIDGPEEIHDLHRRTRRGGGTHLRAMEAVDLLHRRGIPFHVIAVVSEASLDHPDEIYDFFLSCGIRNIGFNIEELEGDHRKPSLRLEHESRVRRFFARIFERQKADNGQVRIREFDAALSRIRGWKDELPEEERWFNEQVRPFGILSVDWKGNFSTFSPELLGLSGVPYGDFSFGSFLDGGLEHAVENQGFRQVLADVQAGVERCRAECAYFNLCGGGAPANKYFENGSMDSTETMYCRYSVQVPVDLVLDDLKSERDRLPGA